MPFDVNFDDVEAWSGGVILNPGTHVVRCVSAEEGKSSGGHPQIELELEAISGEEKGASIRDWQVVTPGSLGKLKQMLVGFGANLPEGNFKLDASKLVGKTCKIVVRKEPKQNDPSVEFSAVKAYQAVSAEDAAVTTVKEAFPGAQEAGGGEEPLPF